KPRTARWSVKRNGAPLDLGEEALADQGFLMNRIGVEEVLLAVFTMASSYCSSSKLCQLWLSAVHVSPSGQISIFITGSISQLLTLFKWRSRECSESNIKRPVTRTNRALLGAAVIAFCSLAPARLGWSSRTRGVNSAVIDCFSRRSSVFCWADLA